LVSLLYSNEANYTGWQQLYIFSSAEATTKMALKPIKPRVYGQNNVITCPDSVTNSSAEPCKRLHQMK
jgi:hypothetical protein